MAYDGSVAGRRADPAAPEWSAALSPIRSGQRLLAISAGQHRTGAQLTLHLRDPCAGL